MDRLRSRFAFIFRPWVSLLVSLSGAAACAAYLLRSPDIRSHVFDSAGPFMYVVPIVVPFVAFLLDRLERWGERNNLQRLVDAIVVVTAMGRMVGKVPLVSGHTLFLAYCILTSRSIVARLAAIVVMIQTIYLKYLVWHDFVTSTCGIVLACVAAFIALRMEPSRTTSFEMR